MKGWQFVIALILSVACVGLSAAVVISGRTNQTLQADIQSQQIEINKGTQSQQIGMNLVRDIAAGASKDSKLKELLTRNGFSISPNASASPGSAPPAH